MQFWLAFKSPFPPPPLEGLGHFSEQDWISSLHLLTQAEAQSFAQAVPATASAANIPKVIAH